MCILIKKYVFMYFEYKKLKKTLFFSSHVTLFCSPKISLIERKSNAFHAFWRPKEPLKCSILKFKSAVSQIPLGLPLFPPRWDIGWSNPAGMVAEAQNRIFSMFWLQKRSF